MSRYLVAVREEVAFEYEVEVEANNRFEALRRAEAGPDEWDGDSHDARRAACGEAISDLDAWSLGFQAQSARRDESDEA